jgi:hypothetical protein
MKEHLFKYSYNVFSNIECQCIINLINLLLFTNNDIMHFCNMYHNVDNYNVHASFVGHDSEEWCYNITILAKLPKHIIIIFHKLHSINIVYPLPILL